MAKMRIATILGGYHNGEQVQVRAEHATHVLIQPTGTARVETGLSYTLVGDKSGWYALHPVTGAGLFADLMVKMAKEANEKEAGDNDDG